METEATDIQMTPTSTLHAPDAGYLPGVTVAEFTLPTAGGVAIRASPSDGHRITAR